MTAVMNKRQQVRNERTLQDLIKTVPGNDRCADCGAKNPGWASWSLGVFLCMRCAALHRKLGTHISKIKSLSMDSWSNDQVENMKRVGNSASNKIYNPRNAKPSIPIDVDEVDGVMERFIRQKYESKTLSSATSPTSRHNTGSTGSSGDQHTDLPPKPHKRFHFGLRSTSSTLPVFSRHDKMSPPTSPSGLGGFGSDTSPPRNKPAKVFGADIGGSRDDGFKIKLAQLKDMGFLDEKKNLTILKGLNGNIDRAVEELVRLGEGSKKSSRTNTPAPRNGLNGISIEKTRGAATNGKSSTSFDSADTDKSLPPLPSNISPLQQRSAVPVATQAGPSANTYNPFLQSQSPQQSQQPLNQALQGLQISQVPQQQRFPPPQQLFPNTTGGYGSQPHPHNPFLQTYTPPPIPSSSFPQTQFASPTPFPSQTQGIALQATDAAVFNPFSRTVSSPIGASSNPFDAQANSAPIQQQTQPISYGPFGQTQQVQHSQFQPQQQHQVPFQAQNLQASTYPPPTQSQSNYNPFQQPPQLQQPQQIFQQPLVQTPQAEQPFSLQQTSQLQQQQPFYQNQAIASPFQAQQNPPFTHQQPTFPPIRHDKTSILALYNMPHLAPQRQNTLADIPEGGQPSDSSTIPQPLQPPAPRRAVTMPISAMGVGAQQSQDIFHTAGSHNPFVAPPAPAPGAPTMGVLQQQQQQQQQVAPAATGTNGFRQVSRDSMDFGGFASGRHSPDAFAGLSARVSTPRLR